MPPFDLLYEPPSLTENSEPHDNCSNDRSECVHYAEKQGLLPRRRFEGIFGSSWMVDWPCMCIVWDGIGARDSIARLRLRLGSFY